MRNSSDWHIAIKENKQYGLFLISFPEFFKKNVFFSATFILSGHVGMKDL